MTAAQGSHRLADIVAKLDRGREHLERFKDECQGFLMGPPKPYEIIEERQVDGGEVFDIFTIKISEQPPSSLSLAAGDFLQNMRSALDYMIYALTEANLGKPPPSNLGRDIGFPIAMRIEEFEPKKIRAVPPNVVTIIEGLQPYHGANPDHHDLAILHRMANIDKHRFLHLGLLAMRSTNWWDETAELVGSIGRTPLKDGAEIARFHWRTAPELGMKVNPGIAIHVIFADSPPHVLGAVGTLGGIDLTVRERVLKRLNPFL